MNRTAEKQIKTRNSLRMVHNRLTPVSHAARPLMRRAITEAIGDEAAAPTGGIFVQDPIIAPLYPGEAFAKLYGLTGAGLRVLLALAPGLGVKEAAVMLGIGEVTARTHLQHVFAKTGTSKQTELLNLLKNSTPPVSIA